MSFSAATVIAAQACALNAASLSDADLTFWTASDLYAWFSESLQQLARSAVLFVDRDTASVVLTQGIAVYANPTRHVAMIAVALDGSILRPTASRELAALSDSWQADTGTPEKWIQDWEGHDYHRVYPTPAAADNGKALEIVVARFPADVTSGAPTVDAPLIAGDYAALRTIAEARRAETDGAIPEIAAHLDQLCGLYEQVFQSYWGKP